MLFYVRFISVIYLSDGGTKCSAIITDWREKEGRIREKKIVQDSRVIKERKKERKKD